MAGDALRDIFVGSRAVRMCKLCQQTMDWTWSLNAPDPMVYGRRVRGHISLVEARKGELGVWMASAVAGLGLLDVYLSPCLW